MKTEPLETAAFARASRASDNLSDTVQSIPYMYEQKC